MQIGHFAEEERVYEIILISDHRWLPAISHNEVPEPMPRCGVSLRVATSRPQSAIRRITGLIASAEATSCCLCSALIAVEPSENKGKSGEGSAFTLGGALP